MILTIPVDKTSPDQTFTIELDEVVYQFQLIWNSRTGRWSLSIFTETGELIIAGVAVVGNYDLLSRYNDSRLPPGVLYTVDVTGRGREPSDDNFGDDVLLTYADASELEGG